MPDAALQPLTAEQPHRHVLRFIGGSLVTAIFVVLLLVLIAYWHGPEPNSKVDWRMEWARLWLEYLRVVISTPVMSALAGVFLIYLFRGPIGALIDRTVELAFPGGKLTTQVSKSEAVVETVLQSRTVLSASQVGSTPLAERAKPQEAPPASQPPEQPSQDSSSANAGADVDVARALRAAEQLAILWEFRYFNAYFARSTQTVLDWLVEKQSQNKFVTFSLFDAELSRYIADVRERRAIFDALANHRLITLSPNLVISVTPKGLSYHQFRTPLPPPESPPEPPPTSSEPPPPADSGSSPE